MSPLFPPSRLSSYLCACPDNMEQAPSSRPLILPQDVQAMMLRLMAAKVMKASARLGWGLRVMRLGAALVRGTRRTAVPGCIKWQL